MAEERESGSEEVGAPSAGDAAAWAVLGAASREKADAFLDKQGALAELQAKELAHELMLRHWSLRVRHVSDLLKLAFELALAFIFLVMAAGIAAVVWQATQARGLVIEAFNVPAPMAEKGLTGQVIADKLLDRLTTMQNGTDSSRAASTFANDWSNDIKVQIADTGVSLGDIVRFLDNWLGHQMHLSGELYQTPSGYALTVRTDNEPGQTFEGNANEFDAVIQRAAEAVFARAQPYRFSVYLIGKNRLPEADAALRKLAAQGPASETAWADLALAVNDGNRGDLAGARSLLMEGLKAEPNLPNFYIVFSILDENDGHDEAELRDRKTACALFHGSGAREWDTAEVARALDRCTSFEAAYIGDYRTAAAHNVFTAGDGGPSARVAEAIAFAVGMHDGAGWRSAYAQLSKLGGDQSRLVAAERTTMISAETGDWRAAILSAQDAVSIADKIAVATHGWDDSHLEQRANVMPYLGYADAMEGDFAAADRVFNALPVDCDLCQRYRAKAEAARRNWREAARLFAMVAARSPSIPFADADWGEMLLRKGDYDAAIAKFQAANRKGPHFADPLEMWGEALMQKNRSDLALAKFAEADKDAPSWGRLHLEWGKALFYAGRKDEARKQFARAAQLDLTASDKAALAHWLH